MLKNEFLKEFESVLSIDILEDFLSCSQFKKKTGFVNIWHFKESFHWIKLYIIVFNTGLIKFDWMIKT